MKSSGQMVGGAAGACSSSADSAAWIGEVLDEPHTRELLEAILEAL